MTTPTTPLQTTQSTLYPIRNAKGEVVGFTGNATHVRPWTEDEVNAWQLESNARDVRLCQWLMALAIAGFIGIMAVSHLMPCPIGAGVC